MYTLKAETASGSNIILTGNETDYQVTKVTGLNPPVAVINTAAFAGQDGAQFNSSRLNTRNVVLTIRINGNVEANRLRLYHFFETKEWVKLTYVNGSRDCYVEGYVESVECDYFSNSETVQVSIICPNPYWQKSTETLVTLENTGLWTSVENDSDDDAGFELTAEFGEADTSFILTIQQGVYVRQMGITYNFAAGDTLKIDTRKGRKSVILERGGVESNILAALGTYGFISLFSGSNSVVYGLSESDPSDCDVTLVFREQYRGV